MIPFCYALVLLATFYLMLALGHFSDYYRKLHFILDFTYLLKFSGLKLEI